ncbi:exodeoxyribonuclease V subunit alpha [Propionicicella superfundia]|uniref:exodeoxyribonuclease V subunit alpha n=1 Tax=Propionicicella superfundia TaxID=348582 RepID=UPI0004005030|nr:exodeoxyribonuclease V subunit alpha [Propionicicella superfundia]
MTVPAQSPLVAAAPLPAPDLSLVSTGLIAEFEAAGVLQWADVHVAHRLAQLAGEGRPDVVLAAALAVWAARAGSVCVEIDAVAGELFETGEERIDTTSLPWPAVDPWLAALTESPLVGCEPDGPRRPLRLAGTRLYLDRYWREEELVREALQRRIARPAPMVDAAILDRSLAALFSGDTASGQRDACRTAAGSWVSVIAGGPGTGKTTTIGRLLLTFHELGLRRIALAAPTGKAAVRLGEAVRAQFVLHGAGELADRVEAVTLHRLLGLRPGGAPSSGSADVLPHDVIVVDEMSMVSLPLMARLLAAVRPDTRLVLVGDPDQLASVEAGAVLADLTESPSASRLGVVRLTQNFRFGSDIARVADAIRSGEADAVVAALRAGSAATVLVETGFQTVPEDLRERVVEVGALIHESALAGDVSGALAALEGHRVLCGHRTGPYGVAAWNRHVHQWLSDAAPGYAAEGEWYPGRPVLVTENSAELGLFNGDSGVVVATSGGPRVAFPGGRIVPVHLLDAVATAHAMTVHKAQGSQFAAVSLILPPPGSPLLTRQLLYTAVTRAKTRITLYGQAEAVVDAVQRPARRASGLRTRL